MQPKNCPSYIFYFTKEWKCLIAIPLKNDQRRKLSVRPIRIVVVITEMKNSRCPLQKPFLYRLECHHSRRVDASDSNKLLFVDGSWFEWTSPVIFPRCDYSRRFSQPLNCCKTHVLRHIFLAQNPTLVLFLHYLLSYAMDRTHFQVSFWILINLNSCLLQMSILGNCTRCFQMAVLIHYP